MVVRFVLPEAFSGAVQEQIGLPGGVALPAPQDIAESKIRHWPQNQVHVVRHDDPIVEQVLLRMKVEQGVGDHFRNLWSPQITFAGAAIQLPLNLPLIIPIDFFACRWAVILKRAEFLHLLTLELKQHLLW